MDFKSGYYINMTTGAVVWAEQAQTGIWFSHESGLHGTVDRTEFERLYTPVNEGDGK